MANEEKELFKFVNEPKYRDKVIAKIHKNEDAAYDKRIKQIEQERDRLSKEKTKEITRIANSRWEKLAGGKVLVNRTEGKVQVNNTTVSFSSIKGAELNMMTGSRIVTTENTKTKSKKHASLGGAVVGGLVAGSIGAVAGGFVLGKTTGKTTGTTVSNQIPTCVHLGVMVNIDGFVSEIVLISNSVDQSSAIYTKAQSEAQNIIAQLGVLAKTPVPTSYLKPEEESSVKAIENNINSKQIELQMAIADKPQYAIPNMYRTEEQKDMSDEEYLKYLYETDIQRMTEREANEVAFKQEQAERKAAEKNRKAEERAIKKHQIAQNIADADYVGTAKKAGSVIYKIVFWIISLFMLLMALVAFASSGIVSGIVFSIVALVVNPLLDGIIANNYFKIPIWVIIVVLIVGFLVGVITFPSATTEAEATAYIEENQVNM